MWTDDIFANRVEPIYVECAQRAPQCVGVTLRYPQLLCVFGHILFRAPKFASVPVTEAAMCLTDFERACLSAEEHRKRGYCDDERTVRAKGDGARWERLCRRWASKHPLSCHCTMGYKCIAGDERHRDECPLTPVEREPCVPNGPTNPLRLRAM